MTLWRRLKARLGIGAEGGEAGADRDARDDGDDGRLEGARGAGDGGGGDDGDDGDAAGAADARREGPRDEDELARLRRIGAAGGPGVDEAIAILRRARGTLREADAVAQVLGAMGERALPEPVRVACADILAARGDEEGALRLLEGVASTPGLILAADLHASLGQLPRALGAIERVLAREIDAPGARERHHRWRAALGVPRAAAGRKDEATVVAASAGQGPFRLLREIARGGAGTVYEAEDEVLGRRVAFKVYHGRGADRRHVEVEVRLAAALAGPGVVRVFDADPAEGWVALEWVARGSVRDVLRGGDLAALASFARWARPLARALARIHERGYVHADVKPANVLLRQTAEPVLGDFGLARPCGAPAEGGSPGYVSPERLAGRPSDPRDDVYGFGRVLEDVLVRLEAEPRQAAEAFAPWRELALRCIGPDDARPADGAELARALP